MIPEEVLRKKSIKFLEYMGIYEDDFETDEEVMEYLHMLTTVEYNAENNGGLIYSLEGDYYIVINFLDGGFLIAPVEHFAP